MSPNGGVDNMLPIDMILLDSERAVVVQELCMMAMWGQGHTMCRKLGVC